MIAAGGCGSRGGMRGLALALIGLAALATAGAPGVACATDARGVQRDAREVGATPVRTAPARTGKERLSGKAADEQRVDNCKVPLELRGPKPRPDDCDAGAPRARQR